MQLNRNTSKGQYKGYGMLLIKIASIFISFTVAVILLNKIDFPSPNKKIEKIIPNENLKIVK